MQIKFLTTIFVLFSALLLAFLVHSYFNAQSGGLFGNMGNASIDLPQPRQPSANAQSHRPMDWLSGLSQRGQNTFVYPAPEVQLHLSLVEDRVRNTKDFRVKVRAIDSYQFFCLNQVLTAHKINYSYYRTGDAVELVINAQDEGYIKSVLEKLRYYEINYELIVT